MWTWKAIDMTVAVGYCEGHSEIIKVKVEQAGRMAGGQAIADIRN